MSLAPELLAGDGQDIDPSAEWPADFVDEEVQRGIQLLEDHANGYNGLFDATRQVYKAGFIGGMSDQEIDAHYKKYGLKDEIAQDTRGRSKPEPRTMETLLRALRVRREDLLDDLIGNEPGEVGVYEVNYVLALCDGRMQRKPLADGGILDWAITRDELREDAQEWWIRHRRPDGSQQYAILLRSVGGQRLYRIEDTGEATVSVVSRIGQEPGKLFTVHTDPRRPERGGKRFRELLELTLPTARTLRERNAEERAANDADARRIMERSPEHAALLAAESTEAVDAFIEREFADRVDRLRRAGTGWSPGEKVRPLSADSDRVY